MGCASCNKKRPIPIQGAQTISGVLTAEGAVRMEYTGINVGSIPWRTPSGRVYVGSKSSRFVDVFPEDAAFLENTRRWKRVERAVKQVAKTIPAPEKPVTAQAAVRASRKKATK